MHRRAFLHLLPAGVLLARRSPAQLSPMAPPRPKRGVMLMNRIAPSVSELYVANADGTGARKFLEHGAFDYHASFAPDGRSVVFTSERNGDGQADLFRCRADGTGIEPLVTGPAVDDAGVISPDGSRLAFVSTHDGHRANVWTMELATRRLRNLTGAADVQGDPEGPDGFFRPAWSPDGRWLAFSSDRNTAWRGHDDGHGWEHTQELSVYVIRADGSGPDGSGFRRIASKPGWCLGSPKWSPDGRRVVFYELPTESTWGAHRPNLVARVESQIVSVDVATGERVVHSAGPGLKLFPQFLDAGTVAYHQKGGPNQGLAYTNGVAAVRGAMRSPCWAPDGKTVLYEEIAFEPVRPQNKRLYGWDGDWEYRHTDVFPALSRDGELAFTEKQQGHSSIVLMRPDGSNRRVIFDPAAQQLDPSPGAVAFQPAWSPDGQWVAFGLGAFLQARARGNARLVRVRRDGTGAEALTDGSVHSGFPSYSADGRSLVFRVWGTQNGLRILDLATRTVRVLTTEYDNLPDWSPDGRRIVFTRKTAATNFDIFTIRPDGTGLARLTTSGANDGHAVWTYDGRIMWSSGMYGFREEAALYDDTFQPYGQIFVMQADGSGKRMVTDSLWEDAMPILIPARFL